MMAIIMNVQQNWDTYVHLDECVSCKFEENGNDLVHKH